jgi:hypothetical protein
MSTYVEYSADTSKYESAMDTMQSTTDKTMSFVKDNWLGLGTAIGLAYKVMNDFNEALNVADNLNKLSKSTGIATEELSAYKYAAELSGVSIEETAKSMNKLARNMAEAAGGSDTAARSFELLGIQVRDSGGNLRSTDEVMKEVADRFSRMQDGATKAALAQEIFGKSGASLIPLLNEGADGLARMHDEAERMGLIISGDTAKAAENLNDSLDRLGKAVKGSAYILMDAYVPALEAAAKAMTDFLGITGSGAQKHMENQRAAFEKQLLQFEAGSLGSGDMDKYLSWIPGYVTKEQAEQGAALMRSRIGLINKTLEDMGKEGAASGGAKTPLDVKIPENWGKTAAAAKPNREMEALDKELAKIKMKEFEELGKAEWEAWNVKETNITESLYKYRQYQLEMETGFSQQRLSLNQWEADAQLQIFQIEAAEENRITREKEKLQAQGYANMLTNAQYAFKELGKTNKTAFVAWKAVSIAETLINTYKAAMGAYSAMASIPYIGPALGIAAAAAAVAAGMAQISAISSTEPGGGGGGGGGMGGAVGTYSANPATGLPTGIPAGGSEQQRSSLTINIQGDMIGDESYVEMLAEKISKAVEDRDVRLVSSNSKFAERVQ